MNIEEIYNMPVSQSDNNPPVKYDIALPDGTPVTSVGQVSTLSKEQAKDLYNMLSQGGSALVKEPALKTLADAAKQRINTQTPSDYLKSKQNGISNPSSNGQPGIQVNNGQDYLDRELVVESKKASRKVSLVGNYGKGVRPLTGGVLASTATGGGLSGSTQASSNTKSIVVFESTPDLSESGQTVLIDIGDIRAAASVVIYMGSPSRSFNINARFISRTLDEADQTQKDINILKAWRMPMLSKGAGFNAEPETLRLFAYDKSLKGIPVMIQSLNIEYPSDMDYIPASDGTPIPIIQTVSIGLKEVRSIEDLNTFSYEDFKAGNLPEW